MAKQIKKVDITNYRAKEVADILEKHKDDPVNYGTIQIPAGIRDGVAKLEDAYFAQYEKDSEAMGTKKGDYYFRMSAVVIAPEYHNNVKVAGLHTSINIPYCDTRKKSMEENTAKIREEIAKLLGEDTVLKTGADLMKACKVLEKVAPYFRFSTSVRAAQIDPATQKPKGEDGVWENWNGARGMEDYVPPTGGEAGSGMKDKHEAVAEPSKNGDGHHETEGPTLESLVEQAKDGKTEVQEKLKDMARARGWSDKELDDAAEWEDVGRMATTDKEGGGAEEKEDEEEKPYTPAVDDDVLYTPPGKKKGVQCKVTKVSGKNRVASLVSAADKKVKFDAVAFDQLVKVED